MKTHIRQQAITMREQGWSYKTIIEELKVSKSTLSHWLRMIPYTPNVEVVERTKQAALQSITTRHNRKLASIQKAKSQASQEIGTLTERDLWMLGIGLYIGEGAKLYENVRIINSDPEVIKVAISWFRTICGLNLENFTIAIHIYPDLNEDKVINFWSQITGIPTTQFGKTQIDRREGKSSNRSHKLPYGTAHLQIKSHGNIEHGVFLHRRIMGWIESIYKQTRV